MSKSLKSQLKRQALVNATIHLVNSHGFHAAPMSKIAKLANVSPATIYLYFEDKQDLVNTVYVEVKAEFTDYAFSTFDQDMPVYKGFEVIWKRIAEFKLKKCREALFLAQCDTTPIIDEKSRQLGINHLRPLLDLWERGRKEGIIKPLSDYILYAYSINPLSFLMIMQERGAIKLTEDNIEEAFSAAWNSIKSH